MSAFYDGLTPAQLLQLARKRRADAIVNRVFDEFEFSQLDSEGRDVLGIVHAERCES
jgi:hypothetical protein